jgi:flagellar biosynthesis protein FlhB
MIKNLSDTKLSPTKKIVLGIIIGISSYTLSLITLLIQDSNAFAKLKQAKLIDKLLAITTASISIPLYILALMFVALLILLYLYYHHRKAIKLQIKEMAEEYYKLINIKK